MPPARPAEGITLTAEPGPDDAPDHADAGTGVEPAGEHGRQLGDQLAEGEGEVGGQVRPRGVPALAAQQHVEVVGGAGERALAETDRADVDPGVGVQAEDARDAVEDAGLDRHQRAAGHDLLGRLEDQPHPAGQRVRDRGQRQAGAEQGRGVHVVAAGVRHALDGAHPGVVGAVVDGERVQVGTQGHQRTVTGPDVDDEPVARQRDRARARPRRAAWRARRRCAPRPRRARGARAGRGVPRSAAPSAPPRRPARPGAGRPRRGPAQGRRRGSRGHEDQAYPQGAPVPDRSVVRRCCRPATGPR